MKEMIKRLAVVCAVAGLLALTACAPTKKAMTLEEACEGELVKQYEQILNSSSKELKCTIGSKGNDTMVLTICCVEVKKADFNMPYFQTEMAKLADQYKQLGLEIAQNINDECGTRIRTISILFTDSAGERIYSVATTVDMETT